MSAPSHAFSSAGSSWPVVVMGGGTAGLAAALASARTGTPTLLIERGGSLGGMATAALVHSLCGLFLLRKPEASPSSAQWANPGFPASFAFGLLTSGGAWGPVRMGQVEVLMHEPAALAAHADTLVRAQSDLTIWLHTEVVEASVRSGALVALSALCRGRRHILRPRVVVDASGDAELAALTGHPCELAPADQLQRPAWICALAEAPHASLAGDQRLRLAGEIASAVHRGLLPRAALGAGFRPLKKPGEAMLTLDLDPPENLPLDPLDPTCLTAVEMHGRALAGTLVAFLAEHVPGFEHVRIAAMPARCGVRESRRWRTRQRLETEDLLTSRRHDQAVARTAWPMELRENTRGPRLRFPADLQPCDIPLGCLQAAELENVLVAGRCIGSSHEAQASIRVMGTCLATGEAAGLGATLHATGRTVSAAAIQERRAALIAQDPAAPWPLPAAR